MFFSSTLPYSLVIFITEKNSAVALMFGPIYIMCLFSSGCFQGFLPFLEQLDYYLPWCAFLHGFGHGFHELLESMCLLFSSNSELLWPQFLQVVFSDTLFGGLWLHYVLRTWPIHWCSFFPLIFFYISIFILDISMSSNSLSIPFKNFILFSGSLRREAIFFFEVLKLKSLFY